MNISKRPLNQNIYFLEAVRVTFSHTYLSFRGGRRFVDKKSHRKDKKALVDLCKILSVLIFFFNCDFNFE